MMKIEPKIIREGINTGNGFFLDKEMQVYWFKIGAVNCPTWKWAKCIIGTPSHPPEFLDSLRKEAITAYIAEIRRRWLYVWWWRRKNKH